MDDEEIRDLLLESPRRRGPGRKSLSEPPIVTYERDLTQSDLDRLEGGDEVPSPRELTPLAQLRYKHHTAARLVAQGLTNVQVAAMSGYTPEHVGNNLLRDPSFKELVAHYERENSEISAEVQARLATLGMTCAEEIQSRLDDPERASEVGIPTLADVMVKALDRSVAPSKARGEGSTRLEAESAGKRLVVNLNFAEPPRAGITIEHEEKGEEV